MGEVVQVAFGTERQWQKTHAQLVESLTRIGGAFGDNPDLMQAKAACVLQVIRETTEQIPKVHIDLMLPDTLPESVAVSVQEQVREAAAAAIESAIHHSVQVLMGSIYDLCTSKLRR